MSQGEVICSGTNREEREALFLKAFQRLWNSATEGDLNRTRAAFDLEIDVVMSRNATTPAWKSFYDSTCLLCSPLLFSSSSLLLLLSLSFEVGEARWVQFGGIAFNLNANLDHFGDCALSAYETGHGMAQDRAIEARQMLGVDSLDRFGTLPKEERERRLREARRLLDEAYAMNGYVDHFLTDRFAAGHIRTPRKLLLVTCLASVPGWAGLIGEFNGGAASQWNHDEENRNGLCKLLCVFSLPVSLFEFFRPRAVCVFSPSLCSSVDSVQPLSYPLFTLSFLFSFSSFFF
jgi:hypothetical protein